MRTIVVTLLILLLAACSTPTDWDEQAQIYARSWVDANTTAVTTDFPPFGGNEDKVQWSGDSVLVLGIVTLDGQRKEYGVLMVREEKSLRVVDGKVTDKP